ncbi:MAG: metalloregulator ArsR/SmtB family transcription factor [Candidatus Bathyarchaeia archaeon]
MSKSKLNKRLARLTSSGICPAGDASKYSVELKQLAEEIAEAKTAEKQSRIFKALADKTRLRILNLLRVREMCVCEIMIALDLTQPTASHHLGILGNAGLVNCRKEGKWVYYSLVDPKLIEKMRKLSSL